MRKTNQYDGKGQRVQVDAGDGQFGAYLARPPQGRGPGIVLIQEIFGINAYLRGVADQLAEEGYTVLVPDLFWRLEPGVDLGYDESSFQRAFALYERFDVDRGVEDIGSAVQMLRSSNECTGRVGALGFCLGGKLAYLAAARLNIDCAVSYYGVGIEGALPEATNISCPMVLHIAEEDRFVPPEAQAAIRETFDERPDISVFSYPDVNHAFASPGRESYDASATSIAYTRSLSLLRDSMGPSFDLESLWDRHTALEFADRDAAATMTTMVEQPYVNHIPVLTGGVGQADLHHFYQNHFIHNNPADTALTPISRTVGTDRLVDEFIFSFTHDSVIDWMLPGIEPTGKKVEIPMVAIVNFRGEKLYHEHIYWDQASVLVQIGLLEPGELPVAGNETAKKASDPHSVPSNTLMPNWREV